MSIVFDHQKVPIVVQPRLKLINRGRDTKQGDAPDFISVSLGCESQAATRTIRSIIRRIGCASGSSAISITEHGEEARENPSRTRIPNPGYDPKSARRHFEFRYS
jgi:hypothetical protein